MSTNWNVEGTVEGKVRTNRAHICFQRGGACLNTLKGEILKAVAMAASLEREPVRPGEDEVGDRAERRYQIQARFDALLVEAGARISAATLSKSPCLTPCCLGSGRSRAGRLI